jgi:GDPmannose 4,6-dehydratase
MWLMLQEDEPGDYVVATGESHSVRELVECAFSHVGLDWKEHVRADPALQRGTAELRRLVGNPAKARSQLGWHAEVDFTSLVHLLVDADLDRLRARSDETVTSMEQP